MPDAEFEAILTRAAEEGARRVLSDVVIDIVEGVVLQQPVAVVRRMCRREVADQPVALGIVGVALRRRRGAAGDQPLHGVIAEVAVGTRGLGDPGGRQRRYVRGLAVQPGLDDGAVEDQTHDVLIGQAARYPCVPVDLHLAPGTADHVFAHRALEQAEQRPLDPARVGPGQIDRGDQSLGFLCQPLVAGQRL
jgi:hypothetical protein